MWLGVLVLLLVSCVTLGRVTHLQASLSFLICGMGIITHLPCRVAVRIQVNVYMYACTCVCVYTRVHLCIKCVYVSGCLGHSRHV